MHNARSGGDCSGQPPLSRFVSDRVATSKQAPEHVASPRCRQSLTVEALGWTEFALCTVTLIATVVWMFTRSAKAGHHRDSRMLV